MIDKADLKLIELLKVNSKTSFADLSKKVSLSPSSVRERINKLEDIGAIKGYSLEVDQALLGNSLEVFILLKVFTGKLQYAIVELNKYPEILKAHRITGPHNFHLRVALRNQLHLQQFIDELTKLGEPTTHLILSEQESNRE
ncbi:Lrp/AsnC family transcriptional regulator [Salegentibacter sp. JZCK2]|uniref:Lrp/AsnC family transcriptional regulator n=1 Tax=Salegentibacter tibetensis TaxID=2873600 RepID=UPI001CC97855|nr:Lrp/AsnC family transcriptional regulator [Salegentibacter tibetensis]MBZ9729043.1 Lrp/AsnC family transcriptional regulator [Salegentibacter tibetensis]